VGGGGQGRDRAGSGKEKGAGTCEGDNEHSGSIKCGEIFLLVEKWSASQEGLSSME